eukprot:GHVS01027196.1.p1 GENE.GHVS01027196.1~~GHVS01027196.1.p1  ORF type:complete len:652 (+),score=164.48 GHVS01027196.1:139-2094(+)
MGINNLLPFLRPITRNISIAKFKGCRVGVDAMCWMHRGAVACAVELVSGKPSDKFLKFVVHMIQLLMENDISPVLVFDGDRIPAKSAEEKSRRARRDSAKTEGMRLLGDKTSSWKELQSKCTQAISITGEMVDRVIQACRIMNVEFVVAPFEADAQLAFMCRTGYVTSVITEDSDLLAYGCPRVVFKMDKAGAGQEIDISEIADLKSEGEWLTDNNNNNNNGDSCCGWTGEMARMKKFNQEMFTSMCVLSGCDYTSDGIKGLGIKTAFQLVARYRSLSGVLKNLKMDPKWGAKIPKGDDYTRVSQDYKNAKAVFHRHVVYDLRAKNLTKISDSFESPPEVDIVVAEELLVGTFRAEFDEVATGKVHPTTAAARHQDITELDTMVIESFQKSLSRKIRSAQAIEHSRRVVELNKQMSSGDQTQGASSVDENKGPKKRYNNDNGNNDNDNSASSYHPPPCAMLPPQAAPKMKDFLSFWADASSPTAAVKRRRSGGSESNHSSPDKSADPKRMKKDNNSHGIKKEERFFRPSFQQDTAESGVTDDEQLLTRDMSCSGHTAALAAGAAGGVENCGESFHFALDELKFSGGGGWRREKGERRGVAEEVDTSSPSFRFSKSFSKKKKKAATRKGGGGGWLPTAARQVLPQSAFRAAS